METAIEWEGPDIKDQARQFFLSDYDACRRDVAKLAQRPKTDHPLEIIVRLDEVLSQPLLPTQDPLVAAVEMVRRRAYAEARELLLGLEYLAQGASLDKNGCAEEGNGLHGLATVAALAGELLDAPQRQVVFFPAFEILRQAGDVYLDFLGMCSPVSEVHACHLEFSTMVAQLGKREAVAFSAGFAEHWRAMAGAINAWQQGHVARNVSLDAVSNRVDELNQSVVGLTKKISNFDRRQIEAIQLIKRVVLGFIALFRPNAKPPTGPMVEHALAPPSRYDCLKNVKNDTRRSQLMEVIDYTHQRRPISFRAKKGTDAYTLADAVRDVWLERHNVWDRNPDAYPSEKDLYSACNHLQKGKHDPFCYEK